MTFQSHEIVRCLPGFRLALDPQDNTVSPWIKQNLCWERMNYSLLSPFVRPGDTVVDVGAHIGFYTCLFSRLVGPTGRVVAFEPNPRSFCFLLENIRLNRMKNVDAFPFAVGDEERDVQFEAKESGNTGDSFVIGAGGLTVHQVRLDQVLPRVVQRGPQVLKTDTQGHEWFVLQGLGGLFGGLRAALIEWAPDTLRGVKPQGLLDFLHPHFALLHTFDELPPSPVLPHQFPEMGRGDLLAIHKR